MTSTQHQQLMQLSHTIKRARIIADPNNHSNMYVFGGEKSHPCWYFDEEKKLLTKMTEVPSNGCMGYTCALFKTESNNSCILIYGGNYPNYHIFHLKNSDWNDNALKLHKKLPKLKCMIKLKI